MQHIRLDRRLQGSRESWYVHINDRPIGHVDGDAGQGGSATNLILSVKGGPAWFSDLFIEELELEEL